jgi:hypothetical protein
MGHYREEAVPRWRGLVSEQAVSVDFLPGLKTVVHNHSLDRSAYATNSGEEDARLMQLQQASSFPSTQTAECHRQFVFSSRLQSGSSVAQESRRGIDTLQCTNSHLRRGCCRLGPDYKVWLGKRLWQIPSHLLR